MIAADTSSLVAYLHGNNGSDVDLIDEALQTKQLILPPVVLTELLSEPSLKKIVSDYLLQLPMLELRDGFWERAGAARAKLIAKGLKARVADALISQFCLDADLPLISRDNDFGHFEKLCGLRVLR